MAEVCFGALNSEMPWECLSEWLHGECKLRQAIQCPGCRCPPSLEGVRVLRSVSGALLLPSCLSAWMWGWLHVLCLPLKYGEGHVKTWLCLKSHRVNQKSLVQTKASFIPLHIHKVSCCLAEGLDKVGMKLPCSTFAKGGGSQPASRFADGCGQGVWFSAASSSCPGYGRGCTCRPTGCSGKQIAALVLLRFL